MGSEEQILKTMAEKLEKGDADGVKTLTEKALNQSISAEDVLNKGLMSGMDVVGQRFKNNEIFIPEVLIAARAMKAGMAVIKPLLVEAKVKAKGKVLLCTVKGDLHDIGKNIVAMILEGAGYDIVDLGTDVSKERMIEHIRSDSPDVFGMSALLTTTMIYMREVIETLEKENLRGQVKIIIGGAPITKSYVDEIHADGYAPDAASAVDLVNGLLTT